MTSITTETFSIKARSLGGLEVEVEYSHDDGCVNAWFASSGNELPSVMFEKLRNDVDDYSQLSELWFIG